MTIRIISKLTGEEVLRAKCSMDKGAPVHIKEPDDQWEQTEFTFENFGKPENFTNFVYKTFVFTAEAVTE